MYNDFAKYRISTKRFFQNQMCAFTTVSVLTKMVTKMVTLNSNTKCALLLPFKKCILSTNIANVIIYINRIN